MAKKDAVEGGLASLEKGKELLDARFTEVNSIIDQLAINQEIRDIFNMSAPIKLIDYYKLRKAFSRISTYRVTNNFIDDLYIYANDANVLVSMSYISVRMPDFYQNFLKYV